MNKNTQTVHTFDETNMQKGVWIMGKKKEKEIKLDELTPQEKLKYEIAEELGLLDQVLEKGWKSLPAKDTARIGGLMTSRKRKLERSPDTSDK